MEQDPSDNYNTLDHKPMREGDVRTRFVAEAMHRAYNATLHEVNKRFSRRRVLGKTESKKEDRDVAVVSLVDEA